MNRELISVIVPVYNVEKYIKECVNSLLAQTYDEIEILLIDDGSTDNSLEICNEFAHKDKRIRVFHKDNEGLGITRNYGICQAKGRYLCFVDSDDYLYSDAIETMYSKAYEEGADMVSANMIYRDAPMDVPVPEGLYTEDVIHGDFMKRIMGNYPGKTDAISYTSTAKLYKSSLLKDNNIFFPSERVLIWEDLVFTTRIFSVCNSIYIIHKPVYYYRFNPNSLTHSYNHQKFEQIIDLYNFMLNQIEKHLLGEEGKIRLNNNFLGHIRTCLKLEVFYAPQNGRKYSFNQVKYICSVSETRKIIEKTPNDAYNCVQYFYSICITRKWYRVVYLLTWLQNIRKRID